VPGDSFDSSTALLRRDPAPPSTAHGVPVWDREVGGWRVRFLGRGADWRPATGLGALAPAAALAWVEQRHTTSIAPARAGECGVADALAVDEPGVAALVVTADCVPVALMRGGRALLVHAGWRGIAGELPRRAAERLAAGPREAGELTAWIGPAIGPCCYEVGEEVATAVAAVSGDACVSSVAGQRPRLDLRGAVAAQLAGAGVERIDLIDQCTRCRPEWLWSYRRDGAGAGRNLTLLWRES
jgi:YfiH family protein